MDSPLWVRQYMTQEFSSSPYMEEDGQEWMRNSKNWMEKFLANIGATNFTFHKGHYEWSCFAKLEEQWWYFSSGDVRFKVMPSLLVRRCDGLRDYTGKHNQFVSYNEPCFAWSLKQLLGA